MMIVLKLEREDKLRIIEQVQSYIHDNLEYEIGHLAAENLLDFMFKRLGPVVYNQALRDARSVLLQQMERLDEELYAMEQPVSDRDR